MERVSALRGFPLLARSARVSRWPLCTLVAGIFALGVSSPAFVGSFEWTRAGDATEVWRLLTAHFTHWSREHLAWDLAVFLIFGSLLERHDRGDFFRVVWVSAWVLGVVLPIAYPEMTAYRGLSGIDCALAAAVGVIHLRHPSGWDRAIGWGIMAFVVGKVAMEFSTASALFVDGAAADFV